MLSALLDYYRGDQPFDKYLAHRILKDRSLIMFDTDRSRWEPTELGRSVLQEAGNLVGRVRYRGNME